MMLQLAATLAVSSLYSKLSHGYILQIAPSRKDIFLHLFSSLNRKIQQNSEFKFLSYTKLALTLIALLIHRRLKRTSRKQDVEEK